MVFLKFLFFFLSVCFSGITILKCLFTFKNIFLAIHVFLSFVCLLVCLFISLFLGFFVSSFFLSLFSFFRSFIAYLNVWKKVLSQQTHNVETTSIQRWFNILTLNQRWIDVVSTLCACWDDVTQRRLSAVYASSQSVSVFTVRFVDGKWSKVFSCREQRLRSVCAFSESD